MFDADAAAAVCKAAVPALMFTVMAGLLAVARRMKPPAAAGQPLAPPGRGVR